MDGLSRTVSNSVSSGTGGMVNELLIQMQSFDQPPRLERMRGEVHRVDQRVSAARAPD